MFSSDCHSCFTFLALDLEQKDGYSESSKGKRWRKRTQQGHNVDTFYWQSNIGVYSGWYYPHVQDQVACL